MLRRLRFPTLAANASAVRRSTTTTAPAPSAAIPPAMLATAFDLDAKCSGWSLTRADMDVAVQLLHDISAGVARMPDVADAAAGGQDSVPYIDPSDRTTCVHVPYVMSTLYRCVVSYPAWHTLSVTPATSPTAEATVPAPDAIELRRAKTPHRNILAAPFGVASLASGCNAPGATADEIEKRKNGRLFALGSTPAALDDFRAQYLTERPTQPAASVAVSQPLAGYELFQLAQMIARNAAAADDLDGGASKFNGISLDPRHGRTTLVATDRESAGVFQALACDAALELSLVLVKWLVEESAATTLSGHRALFVGQCVKTVMRDGTYYLLSDRSNASHLFTSMHHLLRFRNMAIANAADEWDRRGPWKVGTTDGKNISWKTDRAPPVINPVGPLDDVAATGFPGHGVFFSQPAVVQMTSIVSSFV